MMTHRTQLNIINRTAYGVALQASPKDPNDWDDATKPLANVSGQSVVAYTVLSTNQELNRRCSTAPFRLTLDVSTPEGKWRVIYDGDQYNATSNIQRRATLSSGSGIPFMLLQSWGISPQFPVLSGSPPMNRWMKGVPDSRSLAHMSIPGTHESCALRVLLNACCQTLSIAEQLNQGVRFLDIRCVNDKNQFSIAHGGADRDRNFQFCAGRLQCVSDCESKRVHYRERRQGERRQ